MQTIQIKNLLIGRRAPLAVIAGPCVIESPEICLTIGQKMRDRCHKLGFGYIFKASFDKANRTSIRSHRGPGPEDGLRLIEEVGRVLGVPTTTDIHLPEQAEMAGQAVDVLQIPAFLCRQTDLLVAAASTGKTVNVKKGQFVSPAEMKNVVEKLVEAGAGKAASAMSAGPQAMTSSNAGAQGNSAPSPPPPPPRPGERGSEQSTNGIMLTERGTFFGYGRLVNDFIGVGDMMELGWPVCFDVTHSTQLPGAGGGGTKSGGRPERAPLLARAAVAAGVQALFIETHPDPAQALSDGATMIQIDRAMTLLDELAELRQVVERFLERPR